jgi:hypothetical protein
LSDIFREVEEDVRRERYEQLWKQYGDYIIAAVAAIAVGIAGYKLWDRYETQQRLNASRTFMAAQESAASGNAPAAQQAFAKLAKSGPSGYATMATLSQADSLLETGNRSDALAIFKSLAAKDNSPIANVARIRAAWVMVESTPKSELETWLAPLNDNTSAWRFMAREILAYSDYRSEAFGKAQGEYQALADEGDAPAGLRGRARAMASFLKAGGDKEFGTVPKPVPPPVQPGAPAPQVQPSP